MKLDQARKLISRCADHMNARYKDVVFNEWAIVLLAAPKGQLLSYHGPRKQEFQQNFLTDAGGLRVGLMQEDYGAGDFEFARNGIGTGFEAFMVLGPGAYLICNHTVQSMDGIAKNSRWLEAQVPFVELSDQFRADPLVIPGKPASGESRKQKYDVSYCQ
jgi:hypothetical protein